ncbi:unnamed protein product, partial [Iphiclides podalirius]
MRVGIPHASEDLAANSTRQTNTRPDGHTPIIAFNHGCIRKYLGWRSRRSDAARVSASIVIRFKRACPDPKVVVGSGALAAASYGGDCDRAYATGSIDPDVSGAAPPLPPLHPRPRLHPTIATLRIEKVQRNEFGVDAPSGAGGEEAHNWTINARRLQSGR